MNKPARKNEMGRDTKCSSCERRGHLANDTNARKQDDASNGRFREISGTGKKDFYDKNKRCIIF